MATQQVVGDGSRVDGLGVADGEKSSQEPARNYEEEAREMGWVPQEQFHDSPEKWVDAQDFVERGEHILPILRANNKKFRKELAEKDATLAEMKQSLESQSKVMKTLQKHYKDSMDEQLKAAKAQLVQELKEARQMGNVDREVELEEQLTELRNAPVQSSEVENPVPLTKQEGAALDPVTLSWMKENTWFGDMQDKDNRIKTRGVMRIAEDFRESGDTSTGKAFMDKCLSEWESRNGKGAGKVEGGNRGTGRPAGGRAYDKLPKEAKDACMDDKDMFVGPGKMFKEVREWQDHFASIYEKE